MQTETATLSPTRLQAIDDAIDSIRRVAEYAAVIEGILTDPNTRLTADDGEPDDLAVCEAALEEAMGDMGVAYDGIDRARRGT